MPVLGYYAQQYRDPPAPRPRAGARLIFGYTSDLRKFAEPMPAHIDQTALCALGAAIACYCLLCRRRARMPPLAVAHPPAATAPPPPRRRRLPQRRRLRIYLAPRTRRARDSTLTRRLHVTDSVT